MPLRRVCVFCGSSPAAKSDYLLAAELMGRVLAGRNLDLVYGGASIGMMGKVANGALQAGGTVVGVIPRSLVDREVAHAGLSEIRVVNTMHERNVLMAELADAFIALPGGFGTFAELFEVLSLAQLGMHRKPCGILNVCQYYSRLIGFLDYAAAQGFLKPEERSIIMIDEDPNELIGKMNSGRQLQIGCM